MSETPVQGIAVLLNRKTHMNTGLIHIFNVLRYFIISENMMLNYMEYISISKVTR